MLRILLVATAPCFAVPAQVMSERCGWLSSIMYAFRLAPVSRRCKWLIAILVNSAAALSTENLQRIHPGNATRRGPNAQGCERKIESIWMTSFRALTLILPLALSMSVLAPPAEADGGRSIDTQRSSLLIHVGKAGVFSAAAHDHWVEAPITGGAVDERSANPSVRFTVQAAKLKVRPDKALSPKDTAEVQSNMQTEVLESSKYPEIVFQSWRIRSAGTNSWNVDGNLTLHGATRPVSIPVTRESDAYVGTVRLRQTDFDIQPIKIGGGLVKVKDELEIRFRIYTAPRQ